MVSTRKRSTRRTASSSWHWGTDTLQIMPVICIDISTNQGLVLFEIIQSMSPVGLQCADHWRASFPGAAGQQWPASHSTRHSPRPSRSVPALDGPCALSAFRQGTLERQASCLSTLGVQVRLAHLHPIASPAGWPGRLPASPIFPNQSCWRKWAGPWRQRRGT